MSFLKRIPIAIALALAIGISLNAAARIPRVSPWVAPATGPITFFNSSSSSTTTITIPSSVQSGDLGIIFNLAISIGAAPGNVTPSGFTAAGTSQTSTGGGLGVRWSMWYKVLDGTETTLTGMSGNAGQGATVAVFRKSSGTWGTPGSVQNQAALPAGTVTSKTVTVGTAPMFVIGALGGASGAPAFSPAQNADIELSTLVQGAYIIYNTGGSNVLIDSTDFSTTYSIGAFYVELAP